MTSEKSPKNSSEVSKESTEFIGWPAAFRDWFNEGERLGATHVIYCYMRTGENQFFPHYVLPGQDVREEVKSVSKIEMEQFGSINEVGFVFTYSKPFEEQWALTKELTEQVFNFD